MFLRLNTLKHIVFNLVNSRRVHQELWGKGNSKWGPVVETDDVNKALNGKVLEKFLATPDFYFETLELIAYQARE
ncbi:hypothetical protein [Segetibacter sp.]|jgi:hypothetical protein|uniref:hypothetical protein n=1 Tax=Segetibacter sp. TaxID=2231182 RepID=UPI00262564FA|nr:hypothetical protein [Segetibacter sp.]MCW3081566.1 hypothetical protein [Segetibacter sp.]